MKVAYKYGIFPTSAQAPKLGKVANTGEVIGAFSWLLGKGERFKYQGPKYCHQDHSFTLSLPGLIINEHHLKLTNICQIEPQAKETMEW